MSGLEHTKRVASPTSVLSGDSVRSQRPIPPPIQTGSGHRKVITSPPWARHEPPSPEASTSNFLGIESSAPVQGPSIRTPSPNSQVAHDVNSIEVASSKASTAPGQSHWWTFNLPNIPLALPLRKQSGDVAPSSPDTPTPAEKGFEDKQKTTKGRGHWLFDRAQVTGEDSSDEDDRAKPLHFRPARRGSITSNASSTAADTRQSRLQRMRLHLPNPGTPFTVPQSKTPGWDTPWAPFPRKPDHARTRDDRPNEASGFQRPFEEMENGYEEEENETDLKKLKGRGITQTVRYFLLHGAFAPLLIRLLNISFTTATLAVAITIRQLERSHDLVGIIGSSVMIAIIFAPLTLVHVMIAIYLDYFGRPLGLWRTSAKLTHTLLEMLFICMWSSSLSISFDNYYTSPLQCADPAATSWWNQLPLTPLSDALPEDINGQTGVGRTICHDHAILIGLVFIGLVLYCCNLIVSLFRIFEKVKGHAGGKNRRWFTKW